MIEEVVQIENNPVGQPISTHHHPSNMHKKIKNHTTGFNGERWYYMTSISLKGKRKGAWKTVSASVSHYPSLLFLPHFFHLPYFLCGGIILLNASEGRVGREDVA